MDWKTKTVQETQCSKCGRSKGEKHNPYLHLSKSRTGRPSGDFIRAAKVQS